MNCSVVFLASACAGSLLMAGPAQAAKCSPNSVQVGSVCVDKYEASVWEIPAGNKGLINKVKKGTATLAALTAGGAQHGATSDDYGSGCPATGNGCTDFYAASIPGVTPSRDLTWFQATAACRNVGKRLLTNQEWQAAALETPDPGTDNGSTDCNVGPSLFAVANTGARPSCASDVGVFDMVGNVWEWVADWVPPATGCTTALFGTSDVNCMTIDPTLSPTPNGPAALFRGGSFFEGAGSGVFAVGGNRQPSFSFSNIGFRCGR